MIQLSTLENEDSMDDTVNGYSCSEECNAYECIEDYDYSHQACEADCSKNRIVTTKASRLECGMLPKNVLESMECTSLQQSQVVQKLDSFESTEKISFSDRNIDVDSDMSPAVKSPIVIVPSFDDFLQFRCDNYNVRNVRCENMRNSPFNTNLNNVTMASNYTMDSSGSCSVIEQRADCNWFPYGNAHYGVCNGPFRDRFFNHESTGFSTNCGNINAGYTRNCYNFCCSMNSNRHVCGTGTQMPCKSWFGMPINGCRTDSSVFQVEKKKTSRECVWVDEKDNCLRQTNLRTETPSEVVDYKNCLNRSTISNTSSKTSQSNQTRGRKNPKFLFIPPPPEIPPPPATESPVSSCQKSPLIRPSVLPPSPPAFSPHVVYKNVNHVPVVPPPPPQNLDKRLTSCSRNTKNIQTSTETNSNFRGRWQGTKAGPFLGFHRRFNGNFRHSSDAEGSWFKHSCNLETNRNSGSDSYEGSKMSNVLSRHGSTIVRGPISEATNLSNGEIVQYEQNCTTLKIDVPTQKHVSDVGYRKYASFGTIENHVTNDATSNHRTKHVDYPVCVKTVRNDSSGTVPVVSRPPDSDTFSFISLKSAVDFQIDRSLCVSNALLETTGESCSFSDFAFDCNGCDKQFHNSQKLPSLWPSALSDPSLESHASLPENLIAMFHVVEPEVLKSASDAAVYVD